MMISGLLYSYLAHRFLYISEHPLLHCNSLRSEESKCETLAKKKSWKISSD